MSRNFRFAAYLKKCEQEVVIGLAEIKHGVWVGLILSVGVELYIKGIMGKAESNAVRTIFRQTVLGILTVFLDGSL